MIKKILLKLKIIIMIIFIYYIYSEPACAQQSSVITLNLATSTIINLDQPATTVLVANPQAVSAILDTPTRLVLMPLRATATHLTILNRDGHIIRDALIMVSPRREQAIMIDRHCVGGSGCPASTTHYCTDHECLDLAGQGNVNGSAQTPAPVADNTNNSSSSPAGTSTTGFMPPSGLPIPNQEPLP